MYLSLYRKKGKSYPHSRRENPLPDGLPELFIDLYTKAFIGLGWVGTTQNHYTNASKMVRSVVRIASSPRSPALDACGRVPGVPIPVPNGDRVRNAPGVGHANPAGLVSGTRLAVTSRRLGSNGP